MGTPRRSSLIFSALLLALSLLIAYAASTSNNAATGDDLTQEKPPGFAYNPLAFAFRVIGLQRLSASNVTPQKELLILGSGLQRTGTQSTKAALTHLGYKVFHMEDIQSNGLQDAFLFAHLSDEHLRRFVDKILRLGYNATLDGPPCFLTPRLAKMFPKAKVLHTTRKSCEDWSDAIIKLNHLFGPAMVFPLNLFVRFDFAVQSFLMHDIDHVVSYHDSPPLLMPWVSSFKSFDVVGINNKTVAQACEAWNARVFNGEIERSRILDFKVQQGWKPLADFLNKPVPSIPFPNVNDLQTLRLVGPVLQAIMYLYPFMLFAVLFAAHRLMRWARNLVLSLFL